MYNLENPTIKNLTTGRYGIYSIYYCLQFCTQFYIWNEKTARAVQKRQNNFEKKLFRNDLVFTTAPSRCSPLSVTHFTQQLWHSSNMSWNPFRAKRLKAVFAAPTSPVEIENGCPWGLSYLKETGKNHWAWSLGCRECEKSFPRHRRSRNLEHAVLHVGTHYCDATSIDQNDNVVAYARYTQTIINHKISTYQSAFTVWPSGTVCMYTMPYWRMW